MLCRTDTTTLDWKFQSGTHSPQNGPHYFHCNSIMASIIQAACNQLAGFCCHASERPSVRRTACRALTWKPDTETSGDFCRGRLQSVDGWILSFKSAVANIHWDDNRRSVMCGTLCAVHIVCRALTWKPATEYATNSCLNTRCTKS